MIILVGLFGGTVDTMSLGLSVFVVSAIFRVALLAIG
jgi:hypothetical protein